MRFEFAVLFSITNDVIVLSHHAKNSLIVNGIRNQHLVRITNTFSWYGAVTI